MARRKPLPVPPQADASVLLSTWGCDIDKDLLHLALTHRSYANEAGGLPNNERLEFLGDSVLSTVIADRLFHDFPDASEADLSRMRAATVSQAPLATVARSFGLGDFIFLGRGEDRSGGRDKDSILSDTFEAMLGATYLCHGLEVVRRIILFHLSPLLEHVRELGKEQDWKTQIVEYAKNAGLGDVQYEVTGEGPDHMRTYTAKVFIDGLEGPQGEGTDTSTKHAENVAARAALRRLTAQK